MIENKKYIINEEVLKLQITTKVKTGIDNCLECVYGTLSHGNDASVKCSAKEPKVVPENKHWVCHSFTSVENKVIETLQSFIKRGKTKTDIKEIVSNVNLDIKEKEYNITLTLLNFKNKGFIEEVK